MIRKSKVILSGVLSLSLVMSSLMTGQAGDSAAAAKRKLSTKKVTVTVGKTKKVSIKNAKGLKIKWSIKKKKIATFKKSGKYAVKVKGKKAGSTTLTCKVKEKRKWKSLKCKVVVKKKQTATQNNNTNNNANNNANNNTNNNNNSAVTPTPINNPGANATATPTATALPTSEPTQEPTQEPTPTATATDSGVAVQTATPTPTVEPTPVVDHNIDVKLNANCEYSSAGIDQEQGVVYDDKGATFTALVPYSGGGVIWYIKEDKSKVDLSHYSRIIVSATVDTPNTPVVLAAVKDETPKFYDAQTIPTYNTINEAGTKTELVLDLSAISETTDVYGIMLKYNTWTSDDSFEGDAVQFTVHSIRFEAKPESEWPTATPTPTPTPTATPTPTPEPTPTPFQPYDFKNTGFENNTDGFGSRGSATVEVVSGGRTGNALSVTGRTDTWNGTSIDVSDTIAKGATYSFSVWVKHNEETAQSIKLSAELNVGGETSYPSIAQTSCESGVWTLLEGTYTVPDKFTKLSFYLEGPDGNYDFMVDDVVIHQDTKGKEIINPLTLPSLKDSYSNIFGRVGNVLSYNTPWNNGTQLQDDSIMQFVKKQFNSFTLENEMKPDSLLSNWSGTISVSEAKNRGYVIPDNYKETIVPTLNFDSIDKVIEKAKQYGIPMRAHVLMWHQQTASKFFKVDYDDSKGVVSPDVMDARLEFYVKSVMKHVMEKEKSLNAAPGSLVYCWDITNEYIHRDNNPTPTSWMDVYGDMGLQPTYVKKAYQFAYSMLEQYNVQNSVTLFYNDYNEYYCADDIVSLVNYINSGEKAKICGGIGMQSHISIVDPSIELYGQTVDKFLSTGLEVQVTELDIGINEEKTLEDHAAHYKAIMELLREKHENRDKTVSPKGITGVTIWGLYDTLSWRDDNPLLFGEGLDDPKPAFYSVLEAAK